MAQPALFAFRVCLYRIRLNPQQMIRVIVILIFAEYPSFGGGGQISLQVFKKHLSYSKRNQYTIKRQNTGYDENKNYN